MKKLQVKKRTVGMLLATTIEKTVTVVERVKQKADKIVMSVPVLNKIKTKITDFDKRMTEKHGYVYTKVRDSIKNTIRTVGAYELFGVPGIIGICAYKTGEKLYSLMKPAVQAKKEGKVSSVFEYFKQNKNECRFTLTSGALSIASAAAKVAGAALVVDAVRVCKASLLAAPEAKHLGQSFVNWAFKGGEFKEVRRDAAVLGITVATYFAGAVPMTRGQGKPLEEKNQKDNSGNSGNPPTAPSPVWLDLEQNASPKKPKYPAFNPVLTALAQRDF